MQRFSQRVGEAFKAAMRIPFPSYGNQPGGRGGFVNVHDDARQLGITFAGSKTDWAQKAGDFALNPVVAICVDWICRNFVEPRLRVVEPNADGVLEEIPDHPLTLLLRRPNEYYTARNFWKYTVASYKLDGNAYWYKARGMGGHGQPVELWALPPWMVCPRWEGDEFISSYTYTVNNARVRLDREDVVHFADRLDPVSRRGISPLQAVLREVVSDNEATTYTAALLGNMGVVSAILTPRDGAVTVNEAAAEHLRSLWNRRTRGDERGGVLVPTIPMDVTEIGMSPEKLTLDRIRQLPEARIAAALGVPPMVAGLSVGENQRTYSNMKEAREGAMEEGIIPLQGDMAEHIQTALLPDFDPNPARLVTWDYSQVRVLQEDQEGLSRRTVSEFTQNLLTQNEARSRLGLDPVPDGDLFTHQLTPSGGMTGAPPEFAIRAMKATAAELWRARLNGKR